jgi:hypothetical protein
MQTVEEMRAELELLKLPKETLSMRAYKLHLLQTEVMLQLLEQGQKKPTRRRKKAEPKTLMDVMAENGASKNQESVDNSEKG